MANRGRHRKLKTKYPNTWLTKVMTNAQLDLLFQRAHEQGNNPSLRNIEANPVGCNIITWDHTPEGWSFWNNILDRVNEYKYNNKLS